LVEIERLEAEKEEAVGSKVEDEDEVQDEVDADVMTITDRPDPRSDRPPSSVYHPAPTPPFHPP
jgi:hypothetical protein